MFTPFAFVKSAGSLIVDPDARNYVNAVLAAGGSLTTAQQSAIDTFYQELKADGIYSNLYIMYPFLGGVANANKINAINPGTYDLTFNGTWTHSSTGSNADVRDVGTYADTGYNANSSTVATDWSFGYIHNPTITGGNNEGYSGVGTSGTNYMILGFYSFTTLDAWFPNQTTINNGMSSDGTFLVMKRSASNSWKPGSISSGSVASSGIFYGGTLTTTWPGYNANIYINKINPAGLPGIGLYSFAFAGRNLTDTQMNDFVINVNNLQVAFGGNIFKTSYNSVATTWATAAGITNTYVINAVSKFVDTLQAANIWSKMVAIYPMVSDSNTSATAKTQFTYNLVNPSLYAATYLNNASLGGYGGLTNAGSDTFLTVTPATIGNDYVFGFYTNSDASSADQIDMGAYDSAGPDTGLSYIIAGRNKSGANAQIEMASSLGILPYSATTSGPFTGLFGVGGSGTTGYAYRRSSQLGTAASYNNALRGNSWKIGLGSLLQENSTAINPTTKTYQFAFASTFLDTTEFTSLANAVNTLQGDIDFIFSTGRKAY